MKKTLLITLIGIATLMSCKKDTQPIETATSIEQSSTSNCNIFTNPINTAQYVDILNCRADKGYFTDRNYESCLGSTSSFTTTLSTFSTNHILTNQEKLAVIRSLQNDVVSHCNKSNAVIVDVSFRHVSAFGTSYLLADVIVCCNPKLKFGPITPHVPHP